MCNPMLTAALFIIAKTWKQYKCPSTNDWTKKTHTHRNSTHSSCYSQHMDRLGAHYA